MEGMVNIILEHGGEWRSDATGGFVYETCEDPKIMMVPRRSNFQRLCNMICQRFGVKPDEWSLELKYQINLPGKHIRPIMVCDDESTKAVIHECSNLATRGPMTVKFQPLQRPRVPSAEVSSNMVPPNLPEDERELPSRFTHTPDVVPLTDPMPEAVQFKDPTAQYKPYTEFTQEENEFNSDDSAEDGCGLDDYIDEDLDQHQHEHPPKDQPPRDTKDFATPRAGPERSAKTKSAVDTVASERTNVSDENTTSLASISSVSVWADKLFRSKKELITVMGLLAISKGFEYRVYKSSKTRIILKCKSSNDCKWSLRATTKVGSSMWRVVRYNDVHACTDALNHKDHPQATSRLISEIIKDKYDGVGRIYRPNDIRADMRKLYGVNISYGKAWLSREFAMERMRGSPESSYAMLPKYAYMLQKINPGTITYIERDDENHFKYFFMALGASILGFRTSIRPVIAVDAAFLKGKYLGVMFIANGMDGNGQIFPLAVGVGDSESDESWEWFLLKLHTALGDLDCPAFVSDRHRSIEKAVAKVFPDSYHYACIFHLSRNIKAKFKHEKVHGLYFLAAKTFRVSEFNKFWNNLVSQFPAIGQYLEEIGIPRWARAFQDVRRYNIMTTNIAESMNALLLDARELPITAFIEHVRNVLQRWHYERREIASKMPHILTTEVHNEVAAHQRESRTFTVEPADNNTFKVRGGPIKEAVVDLNCKSCTCREFDFKQFPCAHAIAAARHCEVQIESLCSSFYTTETLQNAYAGVIFPLGDAADWDVSGMVDTPTLLPPVTRRQAGRRRKQRKLSSGEDAVTRTCSRCLQKGHNRRTCKNPIPLHPTEPWR